MTVFTGQVSTSTDDASQNQAGTVNLTGSTSNIQLGSLSGLANYWAFRIQNVTVAAGVTISAASLSVYCPNASLLTIGGLTIKGNKVANPSTLTNTTSYISNLALTIASQTWSGTATQNVFNQSPDISPIGTELIGQVSWASGNSWLFVLHAGASSSLTVQDWDGNSGEAAEISVTYSAGGINVPVPIGGLQGVANFPNGLTESMRAMRVQGVRYRYIQQEAA